MKNLKGILEPLAVIAWIGLVVLVLSLAHRSAGAEPIRTSSAVERMG